MKKLLFLFPFLCGCILLEAQSVEKFAEWIKEHDWKSGELLQQKFALTSLTTDEVEEAMIMCDTLWRKDVREKYQDVWQKQVFISENLKMYFGGAVYGVMPEDGRSLYISMHGGGSAPASVNDQQWQNQVNLYQPQEGVYIAPRAPWNDWNMWFKPELDELFGMLIESAVAQWNVNPDKVYLLGYSAGGDGVWRLAPRMADHWAAASMMAGHPGEAAQVNLRNLPYMIWMGEQDAAYNRNRLAAQRGGVLDSLQQKDPDGYIHETHIVAGKGHWMDRADTAAISWMAQYRRNPYPDKIVWRQEEVTKPMFYWLQAPAEELKHGAMVVASYKNNVVTVLECDYSSLKIYLNDKMVDLDKPVRVEYHGKTLFKGKVKRTLASLIQTLNVRGDIRFMFPASVEVKLK